MNENKTDYRVTVTLNRKLIIEDITTLAQISSIKKISVIVSAANKEEAINEAKQHIQKTRGIPKEYLKTIRPTKLPT